MVTLVIILAGLFLVFDFYQRFYRPGVDTKRWPELATRTGLMFEPAAGPWSNRLPARVMGNYRGYELKLDTPRVISGVVDDGLANYRTRIVLTMNKPIKGQLTLEHRRFFQRGALRGEGLTIGHPAFDQRFIISSRPPDFAAKVFASTQLRRRFLAEDKLRTFSLSNLGVRYEAAGVEGDVSHLHGLFDLVADAVQVAKGVQ